MNLSALMKGYKRMCEFVNELDITSCDNPGDLKMYKNIKCALTFVSSDVFGCLCQDNQDKMCKKHFIVDEILDETYHDAHNIAEITAYMITNKSNGAWHWESSNDVYMDIHRIYTNGVVIDKQDLMNGDNIKHMHSDKYIKYIGAFIIYKTMEATAEEILSQVSNKKVQINVQLSSIYKLGEFSSTEEAKKEYEDYEISVDMFKDKEQISSQIEFTEEKTDEYMTRTEIESEWDESSDEVDTHQEFEDNIKLGILKANFSEKMYEKILKMNNYWVIKNDNGGRIVCDPLT